MRRNNKFSKLISVVIAIIALVALLFDEGAFQDEKKNSEAYKAPENCVAQVHILDVGQADAIIVTCGDETMLVDAGEAETSDYVLKYIKYLGIERFDKVIATHPHADHIGGMSYVLEQYETDEIFMPYAMSETRTFERLLDAVSQQDLTVTEPIPGETIPFGSGELLMLSPDPDTQWEELNNESISFVMSVGDVRMMFTGDMELESELNVLGAGYDIDCDLIKVAHHGSKSSSCNDFLDAVTPEVAIVTCEANSADNLPAKSVLERYEKRGTKVYRTDTSGNIVVSIYDDQTFDIICDAEIK